jgi:rubrerythrin
MYPDFEKTARDEGETDIAALFRVITGIEAKHGERFTLLADKLENGTLYKSENEIEWKCLNCGHVHKGKTAPGKCPFCKKDQGWFMGLGVVR